MSHYVTLSLVRGEERVLYTIREGGGCAEECASCTLAYLNVKFKICLAAIVFLVFFVLSINTKNNLAHSHVGRNTGASNDLSLPCSSPS